MHDAVDNKSNEATRRDFEAVARDPAAPHRILLLVNMGTEGWNCLSLFACALVRKLTTSNNFVLQAATRCLRQVPGNSHPARVYLTGANKRTLEDQLAETYGTSLRDLDRERPERVEKTVVLHKPDLPPLLIRKRVLRVRPRTEALAAPLLFTAPTEPPPPGPKVQTYSVIESHNGVTRFQRLDAGDEDAGFAVPPFSAYTVAAELAANHHVPTAEVLAALRACYGDEPIPAHHVEPLGVQIETLRADYETYEEEIDVAVALVKPEGFHLGTSEQGALFTARISFAKDREHLYVTAADTADPAHALAASFHYDGYNLDSKPEREFLDWVLELLRTNTHRIEGLW